MSALTPEQQETLTTLSASIADVNRRIQTLITARDYCAANGEGSACAPITRTITRYQELRDDYEAAQAEFQRTGRGIDRSAT